jgi:hypothetical protein
MAELLYVLPDVGDAVTNTTTETSLGSVTLTSVRGSSGDQGRRVVRFDLLTRTTSFAGAGSGLTLRLKFGGTTVVTTALVTQAVGDVCAMHGSITVRYDGTAIVQVWATDSDASGTLNPKLYTSIVATVGLTPTLDITAQWDTLSASNSVQLEQLNVWDGIRG